MNVVYSIEFKTDIIDVFEFGIETFGYEATDQYVQRILEITEKLDSTFLMYPECRWLHTKNHTYRNIILESYLIIYRLTQERIEVLRIIRSSRSISKIKDSRKIII